ncbi:PfkB family carbohydrate kinase [Thermorudis peleae]|uniref:PfkB family carbohydrate kinase n=1 Tax=Thermorudis peleae TaxID=1382356 RepID=UPI00056F731A|nr:PfkB family carbohydrate kinase [Thermorudis peleae]MBX6753390.1 carbohydrate kinase [Thermorudis peleae]
MTTGNPAAPDYVAIGHVTVDLLPDGRQVLGGTALYAALTAARFGLHAAVLTRGNFGAYNPNVLEDLTRFAREIAIIVQEATSATVFANRTVAGRREQTLHGWAGVIDLNGLPPTWRSARIIHLAPVAQEIDPRQAGRLTPEYLGVTPQGWMRQWPRALPGRVRLTPLRLPLELLSHIDGLVLNAEEHTLARDEIEAVSRRGLVAITRGPDGAQLIDRGRVYDIPAYAVPVADDVGAGDVFASVLFLLRADREPVSFAGRMAAAAAALRIQGQGPDAVPTRAAVEEFLERRGDLRR